ncbi:MAG TPA: hypothetical protein VLA36_07480 [Longimicrobiales bacterium]|nr:hypothetical protein [Longimicrobiales bacterium]
MVALRLLEVMRDQDVPTEVLQDEDPVITMPRRLGLSDVVGKQIRTYREDVRKGSRLSDDEFRDLLRLVIRRPDAEEIFFKVGESLAGEGQSRWRHRLPKRLVLALARARVRSRLKFLFGRRMGGFGRGSFSVEGRSLLFIQADPGGDACALLTGLCKGAIESVSGRGASVTHSLCQSRKDALCRWEGDLLDAPAAADPTPARLDPGSA